MRALVTGGGGFLGLAICRQLRARGDEVVALQRSASPALEAIGATVVRGDLTGPGVVEAAAAGCDLVFHVAAKAGSWGPAADFEAINIGGTEQVIAACRALGIGRLVYTSSPSVVHGDGDIEGADESLPYPARYEADYPRTKAAAERLVLAASGPDLATVALRPHLIWGPGDTNLIPRILQRARAGRLRLVGAGKKIDTIYVDNAAEAHLLAADRLSPGADCAGRAYFITNDEPIDGHEMINRIVEAAGLPRCTRTIPTWAAWTAGAMLEGIWTVLGRTDEPMMTRFVAHQLGSAHWYDISAAKRDLGYQPRVSIEEGMGRLAASLCS